MNTAVSSLYLEPVILARDGLSVRDRVPKRLSSSHAFLNIIRMQASNASLGFKELSILRMLTTR